MLLEVPRVREALSLSIHLICVCVLRILCSLIYLWCAEQEIESLCWNVTTVKKIIIFFSQVTKYNNML